MPDTRRPSQRWQVTPPRKRPPAGPAARSPRRACKPRGQGWAPTPAHPRPQDVGDGPPLPALREGKRLTSDAPHSGARDPALGTPLHHPDSAQRWPARTHPVGLVLGPHAHTNRIGEHVSRNPACPPQRTGGRGRDSA